MDLPKVDCKGEGTLHELLETTWADEWNSKLESDTKAFDLDTDVWDTSQDQKRRQLLPSAMTKQQVDKVFGKGDGEASEEEAFGKMGRSAA